MGIAGFCRNLASFICCFTSNRIGARNSQQLHPFEPGDMGCLGSVYAVLNAIHYAVGGLTDDEAWKAFRFAIRHLADRHTGLDTYSMGMTMNRAAGLARHCGRLLFDQHRQIHVEEMPRELLRSPDLVWEWLEEGLREGKPAVAMLGDKGRQFVVITGCKRTRLLMLGGEQASIHHDERAVRKGLIMLSAAGMFRVKAVSRRANPEPAFSARIYGHKVMQTG